MGLLDAFAALAGFGFGEAALGVFALAWFVLTCLELLLGCALVLHHRFGNTLARWDSRRIARNVADQPLVLGGLDHSLMQLLGQLAGCEFGKGAGKFGFMRQAARTAPATELAQGLVHTQAIQQVARSRQIKDGLGDKGRRQRSPILRWPASAGAACG